MDGLNLGGGKWTVRFKGRIDMDREGVAFVLVAGAV